MEDKQLYLSTSELMRTQVSTLASPKDLEQIQQKPLVNKFLEELEMENAQLEKELQQLMHLQEQKETQKMDIARFSFGEKNVFIPPTESNYKAEFDNDQEELLPQENTQMMQFEPYRMSSDEYTNRSLPQKQGSIQKRRGPSSVKNEKPQKTIDSLRYRSSERSLKILPEQENYDLTLDTLMDSITNIVQDKSFSKNEFQKPYDSNQQSSKERQIKSLEMRLSGTREALKNAEKEIKEKNKLIQSLQQELHKKSKCLENQLGFSKENFDLTNKMSILDSVSELKKREKLYEKKIQESDNVSKENKKYMIRLQELNQSLLAKIKQSEAETKSFESINKDNCIIHEKKNKMIKDLEDSCERMNQQKQKLEQQLKSLQESSNDYLEKTTDLKENYSWLIDKLEQLSK